MRFQEKEGFFDKLGEWLVAKIVPGGGEEVIEKDVNDDASETTSLWDEKFPCAKKLGMLIGEAIQFPVHHDSGEHVRGVLIRE